ncbi:aurora kinase A-interacting protein isoform X1 [Elephas maximus indicus]|uniref:aurora kinase A-interacting protein isoform X1 n=2 Tax=Elephas maximus indicus TaxID=99487 RepID=UPI002117012E|nr:aurora kinase A-interacting protein isoform X1 [Elephas maximus indicus]
MLSRPDRASCDARPGTVRTPGAAGLRSRRTVVRRVGAGLGTDRKCLSVEAECSLKHLELPPSTMFLVRLTCQLLRAAPRAGRGLPWAVPGVLGTHAYRPCYSTQPVGPSRAASLPGRGTQVELEEMLVPQKMSISPLESWLTARCLLPSQGAAAPGTVTPQLYECPRSYTGEGPEKGDAGVLGVPQIQCKNVLKIRRRKMNHHKYRKLVKRTRFLRRKVREGRLKQKQIKFERDLQRIWLRAGLKEAPEGWQTPKIYLKSK